MVDNKPMATPMITNLNKVTTYLELVDPLLYMQLIGSLMYLVNTKINICFIVNALRQFMVEPIKERWVATKHMLKYLRGIVEYGLTYLGDVKVQLQWYTKSYWARNAIDRKSILGRCFHLGLT